MSYTVSIFEKGVKKSYGSFETEKDAVLCAIRKALEMKVISRKKYLKLIKDSVADQCQDEFDQELIDDIVKESQEECEKFEKMTDISFEEMIIKKVEEKPTHANLEDVCIEYSNYGETWNIYVNKN